MANFFNYDPERVTVSFAGRRITGFMDGTFVAAERSEDAFTVQVGAKGDVTRTRSRNRTGAVTITLQQSSPSNDDLQLLADLDETTGAGSGPLMIKDLNGTTLVEAENAWIRKISNVELAVESTQREWIIDCAELRIKVGGSVR